MKILIIILFLSLGIALTSCSDEFMTTPDLEKNRNVYTKRDKTISTLTVDETSMDSEYPQTTSIKVRFFKNWGQYSGDNGRLENGSFFEFYNGALTPPSIIPWGEQIIITMRADKDPVTGELIYSFGPSGCDFEPAAILWLDYSDLGTEEATLYYLDDEGNRVEHLPDEIDFFNKRMRIHIDHFSRYAVAYSN